MDALTTHELVADFCDRTLPRELWTHAAHLRVGLWHVLQYGPTEALALLRVRIAAYNLALGGVNSDTAGYHETITRYYVRRTALFVAAVDRSRSIDELAEELIVLLGDQQAPLAHYSRERLMSVEARRGWVEPDLAPLGGVVAGLDDCAG